MCFFVVVYKLYLILYSAGNSILLCIFCVGKVQLYHLSNIIDMCRSRLCVMRLSFSISSSCQLIIHSKAIYSLEIIGLCGDTLIVNDPTG